MRLWVRLTFSQALGQADLWSDVPLVETYGGKVCYYFSQVDLWSDLLPLQRHLVAKCVTTLVSDLWSDVLPGRDILWHTPHD